MHPTCPKRWTSSLRCMGDRVLVAHNAGFDLSFLKAACKKLDIEREFTYIDTLEMSRIMLPHLSRFKLNILAKELQVGPFEHHRASEDAAVLGRIWVKLLDKLKHEQHASNDFRYQPAACRTACQGGRFKESASLTISSFWCKIRSD